MRHMELHLIENSKDVDAANAAGLDVYEDEYCETCHKRVGDTDDGFQQFVVLLDDEAEWIVCADCAEAVL